ncbi:MAG: hypothetical protein AMXMBFR64_55850 [Myxococcales bacterium]
MRDTVFHAPSWRPLATLLALIAAPALAAPPPVMPLQGVLRDNAGLPVAEGVFSVTFALYGQQVGGSPVWTESWPPAGQTCQGAPTSCLGVKDGTFHVLLGTHAPLDPALFSAAPLWLGMTVESDPELPRRPLGSTAYALHAATADAAGGLACSGCVPFGALSPAAVEELAAAALAAVDAAGYVKAGEAVSPAGLPPDGLDEVSNGTLTNELVLTWESGGPAVIPGYWFEYTESQITVPDLGLTRAVRVTLDITHPAPTQLEVELVPPAPLGPPILIHSLAPGTPGGLKGTWPPMPIAAGSFEPYVGKSAAGTWTLRVRDNLPPGVDGTLNGWSLEVELLSPGVVVATGDLVVHGALTVTGAGGAQEPVATQAFVEAALFGGDGSDGPLVVTQPTVIDLGGAPVFVRQHTTVTVSGAGSLSFVNPHPRGTAVLIKSQGDVTLSSTATPCIDVRGLGSPGGIGGATQGVGTPGDSGTVGQDFAGVVDPVVQAGLPGQGGGSAKGGAATGTNGSGGPSYRATTIAYKQAIIAPGSGGGGGGAGGAGSTNSPGAGGAGGAGAGAIVWEVGGALSGACTIDARGGPGQAGKDTTKSSYNFNYSGAGGGGGGGGGGTVLFEVRGASTYGGNILVDGGPGGIGGCALPGMNGGTVNGWDGGRGGGGGGSSTVNEGGVGYTDQGRVCPLGNGYNYYFTQTGDHGGAGAAGHYQIVLRNP